MAEIKTPPVRIPIEPFFSEAKYYDAFSDEDHSLSDIVRWILQNRVDAEEVYRMLGEALNDQNT